MEIKQREHLYDYNNEYTGVRSNAVTQLHSEESRLRMSQCYQMSSLIILEKLLDVSQKSGLSNISLK